MVAVPRGFFPCFALSLFLFASFPNDSKCSDSPNSDNLFDFLFAPFEYDSNAVTDFAPNLPTTAEGSLNSNLMVNPLIHIDNSSWNGLPDITGVNWIGNVTAVDNLLIPSPSHVNNSPPGDSLDTVRITANNGVTAADNCLNTGPSNAEDDALGVLFDISDFDLTQEFVWETDDLQIDNSSNDGDNASDGCPNTASVDSTRNVVDDSRNAGPSNIKSNELVDLLGLAYEAMVNDSFNVDESLTVDSNNANHDASVSSPNPD